jgi:hypothetical protein
MSAAGRNPPSGEHFLLSLRDCFVHDEDAPAGHQLLDVAQAQRKTKVQPHDMADDGREIAKSTVQITLLIRQRHRFSSLSVS